MTTVVGTPPGVTASGYRVPAAPTAPIAAGLVGWWDASSLALTDGAGVTSWPDLSGQGQHFAQQNVGQAIFKTNQLNGKPVLRFSTAGGQTYYLAPASGTYGHLFAVARYDLATFSGYATLIAGDVNSPTNDVLIGASGGNTWYGHNQTSRPYYLNGAVTPAGQAPMTVYGSMSVQSAWPTMRLILANRSGANLWTGEMAEILAYNRQLSTTERQQNESYLRTKWGTP